jgi:putative ABC transport system permease protein
MRYIGGSIENDPRPLSTLAADHDSFQATFPEHLTDPAERDAWLRDRQAIIIGRGTAQQFGWKVGDHITIRPSVPPYTPMRFHVVSTAENVVDAITNFCRRDYLEEHLKEVGFFSGMVSFLFVKCASKADLDEFGGKIDALFSHSPDETMTQDEKAFMNQFITQQFNLPRNLTILAAVTVFVAVMAAANTMAMNFRDRINELATLKSLGFSGRTVFGIVQSESLMLCVAGGVFGAAVPYVAFTHTPLRDVTLPLIQYLEIEPHICALAVSISLAIGLVAAAWPSLAAARMHVVTALRRLE